MLRRRLMKQQEDEVIDLSLRDVYGNPIERSTANCYVVSKPGKYKLPLVYGNAIKNGRVNTAAFTNNGGEYSHDFIDGMSDIITQPLLDYNNIYGLSVRNYDVEDSDVISYERLPSGAWLPVEEDDFYYAEFEIKQIPSTGANIIISINNPMSYPVWNWHIWLWPHDLSPVEITNSTGIKYNIMPVNLASKYDDDGIHIKNWFYQWGRPIPLLCPSTWNSTTDHSPGSITKTSKSGVLGYGILYPTKFYYNDTPPYNWFGDQSYYNLWDAACTGTGSYDNDTVKTVYDPCPVGWKIPNGNVFTGFTHEVKYSENGHCFFPRYDGDTIGIGIPLSGRRSSSDGSINNTNNYMQIWTSASKSQNYANSYFCYSGTAYRPSEGISRAAGGSVRPVQDDNIQLEVIMISFTIDDTTYQAESGMTWFEWLNSEYNIGGFYTDSGLITNIVGYGVSLDGTFICLQDSIIGGAAYSLMNCGNSGGSDN